MQILNPCFPQGIKDFPFTQDEIRDIWKLAQEQFRLTGDISKTVKNISDMTGLDPYHVAQAIGKPKTIPRQIAADAWRKASERMRIVSGAKALVTARQRAPILNAVDRLWNIPRTLKTLYHWFTFTGTHGGEMLFMPSEWGRFFPQFVRGFKAISPKYFDDAVKQVLIDVPEHGEFAAAGLDNNPYSHAIGVFEKGPSDQWYKPGARGYGTLALARDKLMKDLYERAVKIQMKEGPPGTIEAREAAAREAIKADKDSMKAMALVVNHVWGSVKLPRGVGPVLSRTIFATRLLPAKIMSSIVDPVKMVGTFATWKTASPGARVAALFTARKTVQVLVMYHSLIAANAIYNKMFGGEDVNMTDPSRVGDWMALKIHGMTIRPPSAILWAERLLGASFSAVMNPGGKTLKDVLATAAEGALHPAAHIVGEVVSGVNWAGQRIPFKGLAERYSGKKPVDQFNRPIKTVETPANYVMERTLPIPAGGVTREIYEMFKQEGLRSEEATAWIRAIQQDWVNLTAIGTSESVGITNRRSYKYKHAPKFPKTLEPVKALAEKVRDAVTK